MTQVTLQKEHKTLRYKVINSYWSDGQETWWLLLDATNGETTKKYEKQYDSEEAANQAFLQKATTWAKRGYAVVD